MLLLHGRLARRPLSPSNRLRSIQPTRPAGRLTLLALLLGLLLIATTVAVSAHPLGNFSVNRYSRLAVGADRLTLTYIIDMAEIPAFQEQASLDRDGDGRLSSAEIAAYAERKAAQLQRHLRLVVDGQPTPLTLVDTSLTQPAGQAGLNTLRLEATLTASLPAGRSVTFDYWDDNEPNRLGWREIIVVAEAGRALSAASVPAVDASQALRRYPDDLLSSPLDVRQASATAIPASSGPAAVADTLAEVERGRDQLTALVTAETLSLPVMLAALLAAFGLGAIHALSPGHGKTVVGAYLVGARGTARHALALGLTVTITHTLGVFALGLVTLFLSQYILPERLYPWLGACAGLLVVMIGGGLVLARLRRLLAAPTSRPTAALQPAVATAIPPAPGWHRHGSGLWHHHATAIAAVEPHRHDHPHHDHSHAPGQTEAGHAPAHRHGLFDRWLGDHAHHHGPGGHSHTLPERVTWRSLLALGISGGLLPCPSALVLLLSAIALQRVAFGLLLIVAFSAGLAAVLTAIGLLLVYAGRLFARLPIEGRSLRLLPLGSALLITLAGLAMTAQALAEAGLI